MRVGVYLLVSGYLTIPYSTIVHDSTSESTYRTIAFVTDAKLMYRAVSLTRAVTGGTFHVLRNTCNGTHVNMRVHS
jgi:hypothetical protein